MLKLMLEKRNYVKGNLTYFSFICCRPNSKLEASLQPPQMKWIDELTETNNLTLLLLILPFDIKTARFYWIKSEIR